MWKVRDNCDEKVDIEMIKQYFQYAHNKSSMTHMEVWKKINRKTLTIGNGDIFYFFNLFNTTLKILINYVHGFHCKLNAIVWDCLKYLAGELVSIISGFNYLWFFCIELMQKLSYFIEQKAFVGFCMCVIIKPI